MDDGGTAGCVEPRRHGRERLADWAALSAEVASLYRRAAAMLNYLTQDRDDLGVATKEVAREMPAPCNSDLRA